MTMPGPLTCVAAILLAMAAGTARADDAEATNAPFATNGVLIFSRSHVDLDILCDGRPVVLRGDHTRMRLAGDCRQVRVAGAHNDVFVDVGPGALIEITGAHNDVSWIPRFRAVRPTLLDHGSRNTFHFAPR